MPVTITASRFNDLYSQVEQILGPAISPTYDWDSWYDEYKTTYWSGTAKSTVIAYKDFVLNLYESNDTFSTNLGTRYGLFRKAKALGLAYWVNDLTNGITQSQLIDNFFYAASFSTFVQPDGQTDAQRSLTSSKSFLYSGVGTVVSDRGIAGYGYGQTLLSGAVNPNTSKIDDSQYIALYADIVRIDAHQNGSGAITTQPFVVGDYDTNLGNTDLVEEAYIAGLESKMSALDTNRFSIDAVGQADIVELENSSSSPLTTSRSLIWNTSINHIFTVTFPSQASRDAFFNAGGQVRCSPRISYTGGQSKTLTWQQLCNDVGSVQMGATNTVDSTGKVVTQGYNNLTSTYKRVYTSNSGVAYTNSVIALDALIPSSTQVQFKLQLLDNHSETIDEYVQGVVTNSVFLRVPNGEVSFNGQTYTTVSYTDTPVGSNVSNF